VSRRAIDTYSMSFLNNSYNYSSKEKKHCNSISHIQGLMNSLSINHNTTIRQYHRYCANGSKHTPKYKALIKKKKKKKNKKKSKFFFIKKKEFSKKKRC